MPNPYSRAEWTELQQRFRPPRDGPIISTRLRDYASLEEIDIVVAALQLLRRELSACIRGANRTATTRMSAAAQDAALAAMWAAADRRRIGWILGYLRKDIVHRDYRDYAGLLPVVSGAPGFWIGNVIVMAGVPSIMQAMLDEVAPKLEIGVHALGNRARGCARRRHRNATRRDRQGQSCGRDRSYPFFDPQHGPNTNGVLRPRCTEARADQTRGRGHAGASAAAQSSS